MAIFAFFVSLLFALFPATSCVFQNAKIATFNCSTRTTTCSENGASSAVHSFSAQNIAMAEEKTYYAKISTSDANFCSTPSETSALFVLPQSYFVQVFYVVNEYFKVAYADLEGYVKKEAVTLMDGTPTTPYASATFTLFVGYNLFSSASESTSLATLPAGTTLTYYGTKTGTAVRSDSNVWYYSSATVDGQTLQGYVYSGVTDHLSAIATNTEEFTQLSESVFTQQSTEFAELSTSTKVILIVAISVPSLMILYFLVKPNRILQTKKSKKKKPQKRVQHGDYFEFDESQL